MNDIKLPKHLKNKIIAAVDYGKQFTGLALYNTTNDPYPMPFDRIRYKDDLSLAKELLKLIEDEFIEILIIGVPFFTDGSESEMTKTVRSFIQIMAAKTDIQVCEQDETLSTYEAKSRMESSPRYNFKVDPKQIDALAASIILEDFLKSSQDL